MSKNLKRFLMMLVTVLVMVGILATGVFATEADAPVCYEHGDINGDGDVTSDDAIAALYGILFHETMAQDCDFDDDGQLTSDDAIYLLYGSFPGFKDFYPLKGTVHSYHEPVWQWHLDDNGQVQVDVSFKCGCAGKEYSSTATDEALKVEIKPAKSEAPTCLKAGFEKYTATITLDEVDYTGEYTLAKAATGHQTEGQTATCAEAVVCTVCDEVIIPALDHDMELTSTIPATCLQAGQEIYTCKNGCGHTQTDTLEKTKCSYVYSETKQDGCTYTKYYKCSVCGEEVAGTAAEDSYAQHTLKAELVKEATCQQAGEKCYTCEVCDYTYSEKVPADANAHTWGEGVKGDGVITYTCTSCSATKTVVDATAAVTTEALNTEQALAVDDAGTTIQLDDTAMETIQGTEGATSVEISVEKVTDLSGVNIDEEKVAQLGEDPVVYDFNMFIVDENGDKVTDEDGNEQKISDFGENASVTISLPYTLEDGEDVDSINIWFVADDGTLTPIEGTYSNGFVTFTTDHFSYYTVTRLTPAERCDLYGHITVESNTVATCTAEGHNKSFCQRCGKVFTDIKTDASGHDYVVVEEGSYEATCTTPGLEVKKCQNCDHIINTTLFALGHNYVLDEENSTSATCEAAGQNVYVCSHDASHTREENLKQLQHEYKKIEDVAATCTTKGYSVMQCSLCGDVKQEGEIAPLGHSYTDAQWNWVVEDDNATATVTLTCSHDSSHTLTLDAVVTELSGESVCVTTGYVATVSHNGIKYTDTYQLDSSEVNHVVNPAWNSNALGHYHVCDLCGSPLAMADHNYGDPVVTKEPTCIVAGAQELTCTVCGYVTTQAIPATGEHDFDENGICGDCGYEEGNCDHLIAPRKYVDLSGYNLCSGTEVWFNTCQCGEVSTINWNFNCELNRNASYTGQLHGEEAVFNVHTCSNCDLIFTFAESYVADEEACVASFYDYVKISAGDTTIAEWVPNDPVYVIEHPMDGPNAEIVQLADYGLCEGTVELYSCYCGTYSQAYSVDGCTWSYNEDRTEATCTECNTVRTIVIESLPGGTECDYDRRQTVTYSRDGEEVYSYSYIYPFGWHSNEIVAVEMLGESCEDGMLITETCSVCGESGTYYTDYHDAIYTEEIDLTDHNICADMLYAHSCPCGQQTHYEFSPYCNNWNVVEGGEDYDIFECSECSDCGATREIRITFGQRDEQCNCQIIHTYTYRDGDGNLIVTYDETTNGKYHGDVTEEYTMLGESCEDGVVIERTCADCGTLLHSETSYNHYRCANECATYDLSGLHSCFTAVEVCECACGEARWTGWYMGENDAHCDWVWYEGYEICQNCGLKIETTVTDVEQLDTCHSIETVHYTLSNEAYPDTTITFTAKRNCTSHTDILYTFVLSEGATDCTGGVTPIGVCSACGEQETWGEEFSHYTYPIKRELLYQGDGLCQGKLEYVLDSCGCGLSQYAYLNGDCCNQWVDNVDDVEVYCCSTCGAYKTYSVSWTPIEGETCKSRCIETYTFYADEAAYHAGEALVETFSVAHDANTHDYITTYSYADENNKTCEGGYYVTQTCCVCGDTAVEDFVQYDTWTRTTAKEVVYESDEICGPIVWEKQECACGLGYWYDHGDCNWTWSNEHDCEICVNCGLLRLVTSYDQKVDGKCLAQETIDVTYTLPDETTISRQFVSLRESHDLEQTPQFLNGGTSCEDGYYMTGACRDCDYSYTEEAIHYEHDIYEYGTIALADYGMCDYTITLRRCPCGSVEDAYYDVGCSYNPTDKVDEETGLPISYCPYCDTEFVYQTVSEKDAENCRMMQTTYLKVFDENNAVVLNESSQRDWEQHTYLATAFHPNGDHCCDGYQVDMQCAYCGAQDTYTEEAYDGEWHNYYDTQLPLDLSQYGVCSGGKIRTRQCACGNKKESYELSCNFQYVDSWNEESEDGNTLYFNEKQQCVDCGLIWDFKTWDEQGDDPCIVTHCYESTFTKEGTDLNVVIPEEYIGENHNYVSTESVLREGSESCEDGVLVTGKCSVCGAENIFEWYHHEVCAESSIDLAQYGASCGSELVHYSCACGQSQRYDISEDSQCDLPWVDAEPWIENAIINKSILTTDSGWNYFTSNFYNLSCAVTDPDTCYLKLRVAEYFLQEGCMAVEYQSWDAYDAETETWVSLVCIPTGDAFAFHSYVNSTSTETLADGTVVDVERWDCPDCGSYAERRGESLNGVQTKSSLEVVNTEYAVNGENQSYYFEYLYGLVYNGYPYATERNEVIVYADGIEHTREEVLTYDFDNGCNVTTVVYINGEEDHTYGGTCHQLVLEETFTEGSCSQPVIATSIWRCKQCGMIEPEYSYVYQEPRHDWEYDDNSGKYICSVCGLESANGGHGTIVMEDLTETYGNDVNYVVGYYNYGADSFTAYVSVVLEDVEEGADDEIILNDISITYLYPEVNDITGVAFNMNEAHSAAATAVQDAGYTGTYAIRISMVPTGEEATLDYAITFDAVNAAV